MEDKPLTEKMKQAKIMLNEMEIRRLKRQSATFVGPDLDLLIMLLRRVLPFIFVGLVCTVSAQNRGNIGQPGAGGSAVFDSLGFSIPEGELVIGTGTKAPGSSDSMYWAGGLFVDAPVVFSNLPNVAPSVGDSLLMINNSGAIAKTVIGANFFTSNGAATGHRAHDFDGYNLSISDIGNFTITANADWSFNTTANDIKINAITGLGMNITTTGSNLIQINSSTDLYLDATNDIILDAPDIILEDALTLSTWDSVLVRHPTTGEIQARLASTITGSDSMGLVMPTGYLLIGRGDALPDTLLELSASSSQLVTPAGLRVGLNRAADGASNLDLISVAGQPFSTRLFRASGANGGFSFQNAGTGNLNFSTNGSSVGFGVRGTNQSVFFPAYTSTSSITGTPIGFLFHDASGNVITDPDIIFNGSTLAIGTASPSASAILDVSSTTKGLKIPTMTSTQRDAISSPAAGIIIYNTTTTKLEIYNGSWTAVH